jgi:hypothetical protein
LRKVLVTAFPLRYPEQIRSGEFMDWGRLTGSELARRLEEGGRLRVAADARLWPFADTEAAPALERDARGQPLAVGRAMQEQAQYLVAGLIRDFGATRKWRLLPERQMTVEVFIHDGRDGRLLARRTFSRLAQLAGPIPATVSPGTREFDGSSLGAAHNGLLAEIAAWVEGRVTCLPFTAQVTRVEGRRLHLDVGSDSGLAVGAELATTPEPPAKPAPGTLPRSLPPVVKEVLPAAAIAEVPPQRTPPSFKAGDLLFVVDRNKP